MGEEVQFKSVEDVYNYSQGVQEKVETMQQELDVVQLELTQLLGENNLLREKVKLLEDATEKRDGQYTELLLGKNKIIEMLLKENEGMKDTLQEFC